MLVWTMSIVWCLQGPDIGHNVREWGHVELFSNNSLNMSADGRKALEGLTFDNDKYPTGDQYLTEYMEPLAGFLRESGRCDILTGTEVVSIGKTDVSKSEF